MDMNNYGRNRQSIADLEQELYDVFTDHPQSTINTDNEPVIPGNALVDVLRAFSRNHDSELMTKEEEEQLQILLAGNPDLAVSPQILLQFIAMRTTVSPRHSPEGSPPAGAHVALSDQSIDEQENSYGRRTSHSRSHSRSSSRDSTSTSRYGPQSRPPSRGPPVPPKTPVSADSPFDNSRRQRSTPLETSAPSSWSRRPAPPRRKSDAGRTSDSESGAPPVSFGRSYSGRSRAPSNPSSPGSDYGGIGSPPFGPHSRPHSRAQSHPQASFASFGQSPEHDQQTPSHSHATPIGLMSPPPSDNSFDDEDIDFTTMRISSLPMPHGSGSDEDSDEDFDTSLGLVMDRSAASSTVSLDLQERLEALQKTNSDLGRKLMEAENTLQRRLIDHEMELEEMQMKLEEAKTELSATKREEKELRTKEKVNINQIAGLESEVAKMVKSLENAKNSYQSLQKQYSEQCNESEKYRETLRRRDEQIKNMREQADNAALEVQRADTLRQNFEAQINALHDELDLAQQTTAALDEQKQENLLLKETIDRMRFEMDEMRTNASAAGQNGGGTGSVRGSVSKSLGAELLSKMKQLGDEGWGVPEDEDDHDHSGDLEEVSELLDDEDDTESEDVIQTIITRTTRKVPSRAKKIETLQYEETKEYSDAEVQHDPITSSRQVQTDSEPVPRMVSFQIQTDSPRIAGMSIQTDPEPVPAPIITVNAEVQTEEPEPEATASTSSNPETLTESDDETLASSSSTLMPPTPKARLEQLHSHDLPPAYHSVASEDRDQLALRVANETLKTWHKGMKFPVEPLAGGISEDAVEDWKALKEELGVECTAIDRIVEDSARTGLPRPSKDGRSRNRRGKFYNIYNTYVYGSGDKDNARSSFSILSTGQFVFCMGASAAVAFLVGQAMAPQYAVPGGATYYDRAAWSSFNTMHAAGEGFPGEGVAGGSFFGFLGRLGGEAARTLRGWPT